MTTSRQRPPPPPLRRRLLANIKLLPPLVFLLGIASLGRQWGRLEGRGGARYHTRHRTYYDPGRRPPPGRRRNRTAAADRSAASAPSSTASSSAASKIQLERCEALALHEAGRWEHSYFAEGKNSSLLLLSNENRTSSSARDDNAEDYSWVRGHYLPFDLSVISGLSAPPGGWGRCMQSGTDGDGIDGDGDNGNNGNPPRRTDAGYSRADAVAAGWEGAAYSSKMGTHCGRCGVDGFRPSLSEWVLPEEDEAMVGRRRRERRELPSPTLRLVERLARADSTLCFFGDSLDYQFYDGLRYGLIRARSLQSRVDVWMSDPASIDVNYTDGTNGTGGPPADNPARGEFNVMKRIRETVVSLGYPDEEGIVGRRYNATIRYFHTFGWSPWNALFADSCTIVSVCAGLHYRASNEMIGHHWKNPPYRKDAAAAITWMADFASDDIRSGYRGDYDDGRRKRRHAVWRSTTPQHFGSRDGRHDTGTERGKRCSNVTRSTPGARTVQAYNAATEEAFVLAGCTARDEGRCERRHENECTVDRRRADVRTVYRHLAEHGAWGTIDRLFPDATTRPNATDDDEAADPISGTILRWDVSDLFDVPTWHKQMEDCTHFCYVPPLFEMAYERLGMLLPPVL